MYDVIIIGAGPAGISAGLYAKRANLKVLILYHGKSNLEQASKIENYYGFTEGINGSELYKNGIKQAKNLGIEVKEIEVVGIESLGKTYNVKTVDNNYETKSVILSTGNKKVKPNIKGIDKFEGKGVSYCAICDAFFYKNKNVVVIGNGKFAVSEAEELSHVVNHVTILTNGLEAPECNLEVNTEKVTAITGDSKVRKIEFDNGSTLEIDGVFIALGEAGASDFAKTLGILEEKESIKINDKMETNVRGIFACGNITGGLLQVCKAVYEGAEAGLSVVNFIREENKNG